MQILSLVIVEPVGSEIDDSEVDVRRIPAVRTDDFFSVLDGCAFAEIGVIVVILSVQVECGLIQGVVLFLPQERVLEETRLLALPSNQSVVLLQNVTHGRITIVIVPHSIGDIRTNGVSIQGNEELAGIVGIVGLGELPTSRVQAHRILIHHDELIDEAANGRMVIVLVLALPFHCEAELSVE